jgi:hypothetical protein
MQRFDPYLEWLAIPPEEQPPHHYRLLGLREFESDPQAIQAAADRQMTYLQSCAAGEHVVDSQRLLNAVAAARSCLLNPQRKSAYDRRLRAEMAIPPRVASRAIPVPAAIQPAPAAGSKRHDHQIVATLAAVLLGAAAAFVMYLAIRGGLGADAEDVPAATATRQAGRTGQRDSRPNAVHAEVHPAAAMADPHPPNAVAQGDAAAPDAPLAGEDGNQLPPEPAQIAAREAPPLAELLPQEVEPAGIGAPADVPLPVDAIAGVPAEFGEVPAAEDGPADVVEPPRQPVPGVDEQQQALAGIRRIFEDEFAAARSPAEQSALSARLLQHARDTQGDPASQYMLYEQALELAIEAADADGARQAIDELARTFEIHGFDAKLDALERVSRSARSLADRQALVDSALAVAAAAVEAREFDAADGLASLAYTVAARVRDADLRAEAGERRDAIREIRERWAHAEAARAALERNPDDAAANETLGSYLCFVANDWTNGIRHLAKAQDADLRAPAMQEIAAGETPSAEVQASLGDAWFKLADSSRGERSAYLDRAAHWYRRSLAGLAGLEQVRVEKQIAELDRRAQRAGQAAGHRVAGARAAEGMIGRCLVDNVDARLILGYRPGQFLHDETVRTALGKQGIAGGSIQLELHGVLEVPRDMELTITHIGGSSNSGVLRLYLNDRELGAVGDNRTKSTVYTLALPKGLYAVRWLLSGGDLGSCDIEFAETGRDELLPVYYTKPMLERLRRLPTSAEVSVSSERGE